MRVSNNDAGAASDLACAVVVVCHHSDETLPRCVDALRAQAAVDVELLLVDNGSARDPRALLAGGREIAMIRNPDNPGFARACNQGAAATRAPWLLFLNPDCFLPEGALRRLLELAAAHPEVGLLGAQLLNADGSEQAASRRAAPTPQAVWRRQRNLARTPTAEDAGHAALRAAGLDPVPAIGGALMLMPRAVFDELGGFDEGYRLHCEDLDLCRRVQASGRLVAVADEVRVTHLKGTSSRRRPLWVEWQKHRGMWRYFSKFDRAATPAWLVGLIAVGIVLRFPLAAARAWWQARG